MYKLTWIEENQYCETKYIHRGSAVNDYWFLKIQDSIPVVWLEDIENNLKYDPTIEEWVDIG